jgi:hypothetical protein
LALAAEAADAAALAAATAAATAVSAFCPAAPPAARSAGRRSGHRGQADAGEAALALAVHRGDRGHRHAGRVDAVHAAGQQGVAHLHVGVGGHEAQLHLPLVTGAEGGAAVLGAALSTGMVASRSASSVTSDDSR